jgi:hypothetical protein
MLYIKREQDVSLSFWKAWLYKQLLYRLDSSLGFGIAELGCGASTQRAQQTEHIAFYVLSGQGTIDYAGTHQPFKVGRQFTMRPDTEYFFDCDSPTRFLVSRAQAPLRLALTPQELKPTQSILGSGQCHYVRNNTPFHRLEEASIRNQTQNDCPGPGCS